MILQVSRRSHPRRQFRHGKRTARIVQPSLSTQLLGHRQHIHRRSPCIQRVYRLEHHPVRRQVKHLGTQTFQHHRLSRTLQQARPQYRPFYFFRINHPHNPKNMTAVRYCFLHY